MGFPINYPQITGKHNKTYGTGKVWEIDTHTFPIPMVLFPIRFPSYGILKHMGNAQLIHIHVMGFLINFSCQIFHSVGKYNKPMVWVKSWKLILIFFPYYAMGAFLPLDSSTLTHGILHYFGNALVSPIINFSQYGIGYKSFSFNVQNGS